MHLVALSDESGELELELRGIEAGIELRAERLLEGADSELEEEVFKLNTRLASVRARSDVNRKAPRNAETILQKKLPAGIAAQQRLSAAWLEHVLEREAA
jgi:hypothetical protein